MGLNIKAFKTSGNWVYLIKRPSVRQSVKICRSKEKHFYTEKRYIFLLFSLLPQKFYATPCGQCTLAATLSSHLHILIMSIIFDTGNTHCNIMWAVSLKITACISKCVNTGNV